uniref:Odontogenesis associated phosphoprotein n=2 Tax=Suricata suricatta TaxID=37032 RepID=A0A673VAN9_SURSU
MAHKLCFPYGLLVCCVVVTVAEGQKAVATPLGGSQDNGGPTDCEIFTLTPPPTTRSPVTRIQFAPRTPKYFPRRRLRRGSSSEESR